MIPAFIEYLTYEKRVSPHTIQAYQTDLNQCAAYLQDTFQVTDLAQATAKILRSWITTLVQQGIAPRSMNRKIASLKAFYRFLRNTSYPTPLPLLPIKALPYPKNLPIFIQENELLNLLDQYPFPDTFPGWRDKLIVEILYGTGIRLAELCTLRHDAINLHDQTLKVVGKNQQERIIPFPSSLVSCINQYQAHKQTTVPTPSPLLLVTAKGTPCYPMLIYRTIQKYLQPHTQADRHSPHILRHTFATHLLNQGAPLEAIKALLGHKSLAATQVYTHTAVEQLQKAFQQAHPRA